VQTIRPSSTLPIMVPWLKWAVRYSPPPRRLRRSASSHRSETCLGSRSSSPSQLILYQRLLDFLIICFIQDMELNGLIFPCPKFENNIQTRANLEQNLIWVPVYHKSASSGDPSIPKPEAAIPTNQKAPVLNSNLSTFSVMDRRIVTCRHRE